MYLGTSKFLTVCILHSKWTPSWWGHCRWWCDWIPFIDLYRFLVHASAWEVHGEFSPAMVQYISKRIQAGAGDGPRTSDVPRLVQVCKWPRSRWTACSSTARRSISSIHWTGWEASCFVYILSSWDHRACSNNLVAFEAFLFECEVSVSF